MDYLKTLKKVLIAKSVQRLYAAIPNEHEYPALEDQILEPDTSYDLFRP